MNEFPDDIFTEPSGFDVDTLKNLGPLTGMGSIWEGARGLDVKPKAAGPCKQVCVERIELPHGSQHAGQRRRAAAKSARAALTGCRAELRQAASSLSDLG